MQTVRAMGDWGAYAEASDCYLLHRFAGQRDEAAFAALLRRHGPMVFSLCRRVLDFNLSTAESTTVLGLARLIWAKLQPGVPFRYVSDPPYRYDVQKRVPSVEKAERLLGFRAATPLSEILDVVIPWARQQVEYGNI